MEEVSGDAGRLEDGLDEGGDGTRRDCFLCAQPDNARAATTSAIARSQLTLVPCYSRSAAGMP